MKVILQQDVRGKGKKGQMVEVSDGYARNFLLPKKLAVAATADNINTMELQEKARKEREQRAREAARAAGVTGWVRNDWGGTVSMELQGTQAQIDRVLQALEQGRYIRIENYSVRSIPPEEDERDFFFFFVRW